MSAARESVPVPDLSEARRLHGAGLQLVKLKPYSKQPEGDDWNHRPVDRIDPSATGYGVLLAANKLCSIDPDNVAAARVGLHALGFDLEQLMAAGVRSRSTRAGSGGRSAFAAEGDLAWLRFSTAEHGTVIEFRAESPNLQDVVPGLLYRDKSGALCTQTYATDRRLDDPPPLPDELHEWWAACSGSVELLRDQQRRFSEAIGARPHLAVSAAKGTSLAFPAPGYRGDFNARHGVDELLERHGYTWHRDCQRWAPPTATGAPGVRPIEGKEGLWRSDHASDPLAGTFDAWSAFVVLEHGGDVEAAKRAFDRERRTLGRSANLPLDQNGETAATDAVSGDVLPVTVADFYAYLPEHRYIFVPSRDLWPGSSVNARCAIPVGADGQPLTKRKARKARGAVEAEAVPLSPTEYLDQFRTVEQMTWAPGEPLVIADKLISGGGWIARPGCSVFNLYRPPTLALGDPDQAGPWIEHVHRVFPEAAEHVIRWFAHRVQRPGEKLNHAIVLGGDQGIGKDTILEPVKHAVGPWNCAEVSPAHLLGRFNGFVKSVVLRVSEARDLGDVDRFAFYDHMKVYTAAPPDVIRCDEKNVREYDVMNVCGVVITTNHKADGIYLPADDRRHYVAWSELTRADFEPDYWTRLYGWYAAGGIAHVASYLHALDLTGFDPKAPPPKTAAFWDICDANRAPEDAPIADALDALGQPDALTLADLRTYGSTELIAWLDDPKNSRKVKHRLQDAGYVAARNDAAADGLWRVAGRRQAIYARRELSVRDRLAAADRRSRG